MQTKPKVGILTTFGGSDSAYSLVNVVATQLQMLIDGGYYPVLYVCPSFMGTGIWSDNHIEIRKTVPSDSKVVDIASCLRKTLADIDIMICHDIVFLSPQHDEWAKAVRILAKDFPNIKWLHWQHSRGDHEPISPVANSYFCYPNKGDLEHVAKINSTDMEHVFYVPHPLDINYLGWPKLAIQIAEDFRFPFVDVSMIYPSRLDRQKQVEKAIRLFSGFKKTGREVCLLVADSYATGERFKRYKEDCLEIAKKEGLTDKEFAFLGEKYDECVVGTPRQVVKALFEMSNIFIQVSNSETSSLVVLEAALAGNLIVLNADFSPIHHLYGKALTIPFSSVTHPDTKYYRILRTADGKETKIEDPQKFFDDQARDLLLPVLESQLTIALKKQQLIERWPSQVFTYYMEPLILKDWKPAVPKCEGDPDVTAIITTLDNLPMLKRQIPVMMKECGSIIVVNNGSKDGTKEWLEQNPITGMSVVYRDNMGAGPGRNAGLALWDAKPTPYTLMLDGGILPPLGGVRAMKSYLERHPEISIVSPEIATCYTTEEDKAVFVFNKEDIDDTHTFLQSCLSGTAYCLCKAEAWRVRFSEEGPFGEPGWGVDDNDMAYRWRDLNILHSDFNELEGMILYRNKSGSFKRLAEETGIWPNQYGSVYEKRLVKMYQDYPQYCFMPPIISCIVLELNNYPLVAKCVKMLHDELKDIPHEIIIVDNGSTDETKKWIRNHSLRQVHGDTTVDTETGEIIKRTPENEEYWTGNFIHIDLPENMGGAVAVNKGFDIAKGKYIFTIDGDKLPTKGTVVGLYEYLENNPDASFVCVNLWVSQGEDDNPEFIGFGTQAIQGLGNYAYPYAMMRREIIDSGIRLPDQGVFGVAGCNYADLDFAYQMYSLGYKAYEFNYPKYYHAHKNIIIEGLEPREQDRRTLERKKYLNLKWKDVDFAIIHHQIQPPPKRKRRVAMIYTPREGVIGQGGYLTSAVKEICEVTQFVPGEETDGFDDYIYLDDSPSSFNEPKFRPAIFYATDFVVPSLWSTHTPESYLARMKNFDHALVSNTPAFNYCIENGLEVKILGLSAEPKYNKPIDVPREYDWIAAWHNCGDRITATEEAEKMFPSGKVLYVDGDKYAEYISRGRCALNWLRGNSVNMRVLEVMAIGTPLVTTRHEDMNYYGFVENEHYLGYIGIEEMLEKIQWVKDHPEESLFMADKARKLVLSNHTYYHRALELLWRG